MSNCADFFKNLRPFISSPLREALNPFLAQSRRGAEQNLMIRIVYIVCLYLRECPEWPISLCLSMSLAFGQTDILILYPRVTLLRRSL